VLAVIFQKGNQNINPFVIGLSQMVLFVIASFSVYVATAVKEKFLEIPNDTNNSPKEVMSYLIYSLATAEQHLSSFNNLIRNNKEILQQVPGRDNNDDIMYSLSKIEKHLQQIKLTLNSKK